VSWLGSVVVTWVTSGLDECFGLVVGVAGEDNGDVCVEISVKVAGAGVGSDCAVCGVLSVGSRSAGMGKVSDDGR
jgi:hypothetical protein